MTTAKVIIIGDVAVDTMIPLPKSDLGIETIRDIRPRLSIGGTIGNTAVALARLDVDVAMVSAIGEDGYGDFLKRALVEAGIEIRHLHVVPDRFTLNVMVIIDPSGERYFAVHPADGSASLYYPPHRLDLPIIAQADWLHTCGSGFEYGSTREAVIRAMKYANQAGIPVSLDLNLRPQTDSLSEAYQDTLQQAIELSDYILGSAHDEIVFYTGIDDAVEAARALADGKRTVIARFGSQGCLVVTPSGDRFQAPAFKVRVVDTLGAGDVFDAGFIVAKLEGRSLLEAVRCGNALAALSVSYEGATQHLTREALERLLLSDN